MLGGVGCVETGRHQSQRDGPHDRFGAAAGVQLVVDLGQVALDGAVTDVELGADGLIGLPLGRQTQDVELAVGQVGGGQVGGAGGAMRANSLCAIAGSSTERPSCTALTASIRS